MNWKEIIAYTSLFLFFRIPLMTDKLLYDESYRITINNIVEKVLLKGFAASPLIYFQNNFFDYLLNSITFERIIPLFFGFLTMIIWYKIGKKYNIELFTTFFFITNPLLIIYSIQLSQYIFSIFILSYLYYKIFILEESSGNYPIIYGILFGIGFYYHYLFALIIPFFLIKIRGISSIHSVIRSIISGFIIIIPLLPVLFYELILQYTFLYSFSFSDSITHLLTIPFLFTNSNLLILTIIGFLLYSTKQDRQINELLWVGISFTFILFLLSIGNFSMFVTRYIVLVQLCFVLPLLFGFSRFQYAGYVFLFAQFFTSILMVFNYSNGTPLSLYY